MPDVDVNVYEPKDDKQLQPNVQVNIPQQDQGNQNIPGAQPLTQQPEPVQINVAPSPDPAPSE